MGSGWDKASERAEKGSGGGNFIRLADHGEKIVVAFVGDPHWDDLIWNTKLNAYEPFTDAHKAEGKSPTPRYKMNCYVPADKTMKVWEVNNTTFQDVLKVKQKYGLDEMFFEVERNGKKGDTKTTYTILPETKIDDAHKAIMKKLPLHDLTKARENAGDAQTDMNSHDKKTNGANGATSAPVAEFISPEETAAIIGRLKVLPREKLSDFLTKFGVTQIKALKKADYPAALAWVDEAEGKKAAPAQAPTEIDPFA